MSMDEERPREPLPIWFFVGVILLVFGLIIVGADLHGIQRQTVLGETRPALWWGAIMCVGGAILSVVGWVGYRRTRGGR